MLLKLSVFVVVQIDRQISLKYGRFDECEHISEYTPVAYSWEVHPGLGKRSQAHLTNEMDLPVELEVIGLNNGSVTNH